MNTQKHEAQQKRIWGDIWDKPAYLRRQYAKGLITREEMDNNLMQSESKSRCCGAEILEGGQCTNCGEGCGYDHFSDHADEEVKALRAD